MPISLKNMRGCASPASTAICTSTTDPRSMIRHRTVGTPRPIHHRLNSFLHDQYTNLTTMPAGVAAPCISELPITPRSLHRKSSTLKKHFSNAGDDDFARRRSSAEIAEYLRRRKSSAPADISDVLRRSPPGSSRYLLSETPSFREDLPADDDEKLKKYSLALVPSEPLEEVSTVGPIGRKSHGYGHGVGRRDDLVQSTPVYRRDLDLERSRALVSGKPRYKGSNGTAGDERNRRSGLNERGVVKSSPPPARSEHQVVVLMVSLHCKGCEGKLRKHLTKMEGVSSFSIDLETKKVTVIGNITPLGVLTSISKVKNAQFWPSPSTSASSFSSNSSSSALSRSEFSY